MKYNPSRWLPYLRRKERDGTDWRDAFCCVTALVAGLAGWALWGYYLSRMGFHFAFF